MTVDAEGACKRCGSGNTSRIFSAFRVRMAKPGVDQLNKAELLDGVDYTDPHSMANFFRNMGDAFQDEPDEGMTEVVERLDHGEPVHEALQLDMGHDHGGHSHDTSDDD